MKYSQGFPDIHYKPGRCVKQMHKNSIAIVVQSNDEVPVKRDGVVSFQTELAICSG